MALPTLVSGIENDALCKSVRTAIDRADSTSSSEVRRESAVAHVAYLQVLVDWMHARPSTLAKLRCDGPVSVAKMSNFPTAVMSINCDHWLISNRTTRPIFSFDCF